MLASSVAANATGLDFVINEQVVPGVSGNVYGAGGFPGLTALQVDEMQGSYRELFTVTGPGTFSSIAFAQINTFLDNSVVIGGVPAPVAPAPYTFLSGSTSGGGDNGSPFTAPYYALYGLFEAGGTFTGGGVFTGTSGDIELWLDPNRDTIATIDPLTQSAATPWSSILAGTSDDIRLAFSSDLVYGLGDTILGFDLVFNSLGLTQAGDPNTTPTTNGDSFFVAPRPFHTAVRLDGAFQPFSPSGTSLITGGVSIQFAVPEPGMVGLLGLGCTAGGFVAWRRRRVK